MLIKKIYQKTFVAHPFISTAIILVAVILIGGEPTNAERGATGNSERTPDGLTKSAWTSRCVQYASARSECAVAAKVSNCIEIKMGQTAAVMAQTYCDGSTPNFSLMGVR